MVRGVAFHDPHLLLFPEASCPALIIDVKDVQKADATPVISECLY